MTRVGAAGAAIAVAAAALTQTALAGDAPRQALLRSTAAPLDARLPLSSDVTTPPDVLPGGSRVTGSELVTVIVDHAGTPQAVRVRQRLVLVGTGDYSLVVPAPLVDALPAPGSDSVPGRRSGGIVWQGFVGSRRVLAAAATLRRAAAAALPIRLRITTTVDGRRLESGERRSGHVEVRLEIHNRTAVQAQGFDAPAVPAQIAPVLDRLRTDAARGRVAPDRYLSIQGDPRPRSFVVDAPFAVSGKLRLPASTLENVEVDGGTVAQAAAGVVRFETVLTGSRSSAVVVLAGDGSGIEAPSLELTAHPLAVVPGLQPPGGGTWREGVAAGRAPNGRALVALASRASLQLARVQQFEEFLSVPGRGEASIRYRYRTAGEVRSQAGRQPDDGSSVPMAALWLVGVVVVLGGLTMVWARL